jgi:hypothetical protein
MPENKISEEMEKAYDTSGLFGISVGVNIEKIDLFLREATRLNEDVNRINNKIKFVVVDVAHGDHKLVMKAIEYIKKNYSKFKIIAGNVCTGEGARNLAIWGADAVKVGIGPGCFTPEMKVKTDNGLKEIKDIEIGDKVITHTGEFKEVEHKFEFDRDEEIIVINNEIKCTKNHEFYVVHKRYEGIVNEDNIHQYAEWIDADKLNENYFLIEY